MIAAALTLFSGGGSWLIAILAGIGGIAVAYFKGHSVGTKKAEAVAVAEKNETNLVAATDTLAAVKERNENDSTVAALPADAVSKQLQDDWTR